MSTEFEHQFVPKNQKQYIELQIMTPYGNLVTVSVAGFSELVEAVMALQKAALPETLVQIMDNYDNIEGNHDAHCTCEDPAP